MPSVFQEMENDERDFDAEGENEELFFAFGFRFTERSKRNLELNKLDIGNALLVLGQNAVEIGTTSESELVYGECEKGKAIIIVRPIPSRPGKATCFDVISGFIVS